MLLSELLPALRVKSVRGRTDIDITGLAMDSRKTAPGNIFVVLTEPELEDRTKFIPNAIEAGAVAVLADHPIEGLEATQIIVPETQIASAWLASSFYGDPLSELNLVGITGTKGKTTTSNLTAKLLAKGGSKTGVIGTTGVWMGSQFLGPSNTTPHAIELQRLFRAMADGGVKTVSMEVSSHALRLHRTAGCRFDVAAFTNIGHDHMNFHKSMEDYVQAKSLLMAKVVKGLAVINIDDPWAEAISSSASCERLTYGFSDKACLKASDVAFDGAGTKFRLTFRGECLEVRTKLSGMFNVYNCLAAIGSVFGCGMDPREAVRFLPELEGVEGRLEPVDTDGKGFNILVDYAHTAESMENVLQTLVAMKPNRLITVFGCGGDRDTSKRPVMGAISAKYSDYVLVTSDNPRTEDPDTILLDIEAGLRDAEVEKSKYELLPDRREAINKAIAMAVSGDIIAILGKGHEAYQEINHIRHPFDDRLIAKEAADRK